MVATQVIEEIIDIIMTITETEIIGIEIDVEQMIGQKDTLQRF